MRNNFKQSGFIALMAVITMTVLSMTVCTTEEAVKSTPLPEYFDFGNLAQFEGYVIAVTVKPKTTYGDLGEITIYYNGDETLPEIAGTYAVTFDVAESTYWKAAAGLSAGNLNILAPLADAAEFATWLSSAPYNTIDTPHIVPLSVNALGNAGDPDSVGGILQSNKTKFVKLDLSGSDLTYIEYNAFYNCSNLTGITLPDGVERIGTSAFYNCPLTSVTIPAGVTSIAASAFSDCKFLTAITVDSANTAYCSQDGVLYNKAKTLLMLYPIGKAGNSFAIPSGVTEIGAYAFSWCAGLTSVTIPAGVTSIADRAFYNCNFLTRVTFEGSNVDITTDICFPGGSSLRSVYQSGGAGTYTRAAGGSTWTKEE